MKPLITVLCLLCGIIFAACARHSEVPKPLLVVVTFYHDPGPPGAGSPMFALYDDGSIICYHEPVNFHEWIRQKLRDRGNPPWGANLSDDPEYPTAEKFFTIRKVKNPEKKVAELLTFDLNKTETLYRLSSATSQPITLIWTPNKTIEIYGDWKNPRRFEPAWEKDPQFQEIIKRETALWKSFPDEIRQFLLCIEKENAIAGTPWLPEKFDSTTERFPFPNEEHWLSKPFESISLESFQESSQ